jgi:RHS repeat-associated protein
MRTSFHSRASKLVVLALFFQILAPGFSLVQAAEISAENSVESTMTMETTMDLSPLTGPIETDQTNEADTPEREIDGPHAPNDQEEDEGLSEIDLDDIEKMPLSGDEEDTYYSDSYALAADFVHGDGSILEDKSGAFIYQYPITLPPGRNGVTPQLQLTYNSQANDFHSTIGFNWSIDIPKISRVRENGVETLYEDNVFTSSLEGELVYTESSSPYGSYAAELEQGSFNQYTYDEDGYWLMTTKEGTTYTFGEETEARHEDPEDSARVYSWLLESIEDANGNRISFYYTEDEGQMYIDSITYTEWENEDGIFEVTFTYEEKEYPMPAYDKGFEQTTNNVLKNIDVYMEETWIRGVEIAHTHGDHNYKDLLTSITESALDEDDEIIALPSTEFEYSETTLDPSRTFSDETNDGDAETVTYNDAYWVEDSTYHVNDSLSFIDDGKDDENYRFLDVNSDGLKDIVRVYGYTDKDEWEDINVDHVYMNQGGHGWEDQVTEYQDYFVAGLDITDEAAHKFNASRNHIRFGDINGDNITDIVRYVGYNEPEFPDSFRDAVYQREEPNSYFEIELDHNLDDNDCTTFTSYTGNVRRNPIELIDVNGDGMADMVFSSLSSSDTSDVSYQTCINNGEGTGWTYDSSQSNFYGMPVGLGQYTSTYLHQFNQQVYFQDVNKDGLIDVMKSMEDENQIFEENDYMGDEEDRDYPADYIVDGVYLNNGVDDWERYEKNDYYHYDGDYVYSNGTKSWANAYVGDMEWPNGHWVDINGDGFTDFINAYEDRWEDAYYTISQINFGGKSLVNEADEEQHATPIFFYDNWWDYGVRFLDVDGDGMQDILHYNETDGAVYINQLDPADRLIGINHRMGGTTEIEYKMTTEYYDEEVEELLNPLMHQPIETVYQITQSDAVEEDELSTIFSYSGGEYWFEDATEKGFSGFETITKTTSENYSVSTYNQGEEDTSLIGMLEHSEVYDTAGTLYASTVNNWDYEDLGYDNDFVSLGSSINYSYEGEGTSKATANAYTYDEYGNLLTETQYGQVTANEDLDGTFTDDDSSDNRVMSMDYAVDLDEIINGKVTQSTLEDNNGNTLSTVKYYYDDLDYGEVEQGLITKQSSWLDTDGSWIDSTFEYDDYGMLEVKTNPRGYSVTYNYDSENYYPESVDSELFTTMELEHDYTTGNTISSTGPNGFTTSSVFDGFGRLLSQSIPDPSTEVEEEVMSMSYDTESFPTSVSSSSIVDSITMSDVKYFDGLGRTIQQKASAEDGNFTTVDIWYNELGQVEKQTLPYFTSSSEYEARDDSQVSTTYTYDAMGRVITESWPIGTTSTTYNQWAYTITNPNGIEQSYTLNAFGQLTQVEENNGSETYTTSYEYDLLGNFTKLTDAQGNEREFAFNSLGRQTSLEDLHSPDQAAPTWTYTYDSNGNVQSQTDPKGQTIAWSYDELDRPLSEDWDDDSSTDITYTYDSASNGIGMLDEITMDSMSTSFSYNALGLVDEETKTIDEITYTTSYLYDLLGREVATEYPNSAMTVSRSYNEMGLEESVTQTVDSVDTEIVSNYDYNAMGQVELVEYGNGQSTVNTYDPEQNYRLTNKVSYGIYALDSDGDMLLDEDEENTYLTDPYDADSDEDGLFDGAEVNVHNTDPLDEDSDGDGVNDGQEVKQDGTDPNNSSDYTAYTNPASKFLSWLIPTAQASSGSDLYITGLTLSEDLVLSYTLGNQGDSDADHETTGAENTIYLDGTELLNVLWSSPSAKADQYTASGDSRLRSWNLTPYEELTTLTSGDTYEITVCIDEADLTGDDDTTNNCETYDWEFLGELPDPVVTINSIGEESLEISYTLSNEGEVDLPALNNVYNFIYLDGVEQASTSWQSDADSADYLLAGGSVDKTYTLDSSSLMDGDSYTIEVCTNKTMGSSTYVMGQHDESNDCESLDFTYSDGITSGVDLGVKGLMMNDNLTLGFKIGNMGSTDVDPETTGGNYRIYLDSILLTEVEWSSDPNDATNYLTSLSVLKPMTPLFSYEEFASLTSGDTYELEVCIDEDNVTLDDDRTNNCSSLSWTFDGDLSDPSANITAFQLNTLELTYTLSNEGESELPPLGNAYQTISLDGIELESTSWTDDADSSSYLAAGGSASKTITIDSTLLTEDAVHSLEVCTNVSASGASIVNAQHDSNNDCDALSFLYTLPEASTSEVQSLSYSYDDNGNILQIVDDSSSSTAKTVDYTYDDLSRLLSATSTDFGEGDYSLSYSYDAVGNMLCKSDLGDGTMDDDGMPVPLDCTDEAAQNMYYTGTGETSPHAVTSLIDGTTLTYDANGNLETVTLGGDESEEEFSLKSDTYVWNIKNQLESAGNSSYTYDAAGQRLTTNYSLDTDDDGTPDEEWTDTYVNRLLEIRDDVESYSIFAGGARVATYKLTDQATTYHYQDHLGGSTHTTDEDGNVIQLTDYAPYGSQILDEQLTSDETDHSFTDKEYDSDLALYYFEARWYSPVMGRFTSSDPASRFTPASFMQDPQQLNAYSYARNNPLYYVDPTGLYNVETGEIEEGDSKESITATVNETYGTDMSWSELLVISNLNNHNNPWSMIDGMVGIELSVGTNNTTDVTEELTMIMENISEIAAAEDWDMGAFKDHFCGGCTYDLKNIEYTVYYKDTKYTAFVFGDKLIRKDAPGNMVYGYVGKDMGINGLILQLGGQYAQIMSTHWLDDGYDQQMIKYGINLNKNK